MQTQTVSHAIVGAMLWVPENEVPAHRVRDFYTIKQHGRDYVTKEPTYQEIPLYRDGKPPYEGYIGVPITDGLARFQTDDLREEFAEPVPFTSWTRRPDPDHPLAAPGQREFFEDTHEALTRNYAALVKASTGTGKTAAALDMAARLGVRTLILVPLERLRLQWIKAIETHLGVPRDRIGEVVGPKCQWGRDIVVGMMKSVAMRVYPPELYSAFGFIVTDECFHPDHELLVRGRGWVPIAQVSQRDSVMAYDTRTGGARFEEVTRVVNKRFTGEMVRLRGRWFHTLTTPNHEQPVMRTKGGCRVGRLRTVDIYPQSGLCVPYGGMLEGNDSELTPMDRLRIAYEADGYLLYGPREDGGYTYRFSFRRQRKITRLRWLLDSCGIGFKEKVNGRGDTNITFTLPIRMDKSLGWFDPTESLQRSEGFIQEVAEWDGWRTETAILWETPSEDDALRFQTAAHLVGARSSVLVFKPNRYRVSASRVGGDGWLHSSALRKTYESYSGPVHCVTVSSGNVFTRLGGVISISGNCHNTGAMLASQTQGLFNAEYKLALTATDKRRDGGDRVYYSMYGRPAFERSMRSLDTDVYVVAYTAKKPPSGKDKTSKLISLAYDFDRNRFITDLAVRWYEGGHFPLFLCDHVRHAEVLRKMFLAAGIPEKDLGMYCGEQVEGDGRAKSSPEYLKWVEEKATVVIATTGMMKEGIDMPRMDRGMDVSPRADLTQQLGRIRRAFPGKRRAAWVMIRDRADRMLEGLYFARVKDIRDLGGVTIRKSSMDAVVVDSLGDEH